MARKRRRHGQPATQAQLHYDIVAAGGEGFERRFRSHVDMYGPAAACGGRCHLWTGGARWTKCEAPSEWYGKIGASAPGGRKATMRVHRVAWMLAHGKPPPANRWVLHRCDNRMCVNPLHLYLGTHGDNMRDRARKLASGAPDPIDRKRGRPRRELSAEEVRRMRANLLAGATKRSQMRQFGASTFAVYDVAGRLGRGRLSGRPPARGPASGGGTGGDPSSPPA